LHLNIRYMRGCSVTSTHVLPQGNEYSFKLWFLGVYSIAADNLFCTNASLKTSSFKYMHPLYSRGTRFWNDGKYSKLILINSRYKHTCITCCKKY
jgi:hypothetical protein